LGCEGDAASCAHIRSPSKSGWRQASSGIALYAALTEVASNKESDTFTISQAAIAEKAGLTTRTLRRIMPVLVKLRLVTITQNAVEGLQRQSTYTLNPRYRRAEIKSTRSENDEKIIVLRKKNL
jgi:hypothetical protein